MNHLTPLLAIYLRCLASHCSGPLAHSSEGGIPSHPLCTVTHTGTLNPYIQHSARFQTSITFVLFNVELSNLAPMGTIPAHQFSTKSPKSVSSYPVVRCIFCFVCIFFVVFWPGDKTHIMLIIPNSPCLELDTQCLQRDIIAVLPPVARGKSDAKKFLLLRWS